MLMNPNSTAAECQFASDTLQYGEQTRLYRNANVAIADRDNESITDDINTSIYTKYAPRDIESVMAGHAQGLGVSSYSAVRMSSIGISYHNVNKYVVTLQFASGAHIDPQNIKVRIGDTTYGYGSKNVVDNGDGTWTITSDGISAYNFFDNDTVVDIPFRLYVNNKVVQQATYNIKDYVCQLQDTTQSGSLAVKYARSLYRYAQSAEAAYKGNRIVAIALNSNPDNIVPGSTGAQTPGGGSIIAYYSDGSHQQINEGIVWPNKDIHGKNVAITDDTHMKTFDILGSYTDPVSKKVYTVSAQVTLHNDMTSIERWTDPDIYDCKSYVASYTPTNGLVKCTWSNGYQATRTPTYTAISMADYKEDEYGFIPVTASYTDPKSGEDDAVTMYVLYKNPITAITIANTTANYNDGTIDNATTPHASTYTVTYQNGTVSAAKNTGSTWNSTIQNGGSTQTKSYSFTWTNLTSTSTEYRISFTQTANGTLNRPGYGTWTRKANGGNATFTANNGTTDDSCTATVTNPEYQLTLSSAPYVHGSTVKSTSNLTGSQNSTTAGQWRGGTVTMKYCNGAVEDVTASVTYSSPSITNTAYSKNVTVTATYTKKAGGNATATKANVKICNYMVSISQYQAAKVYAASTTNTQLKLTNTTHTILATYANGQTEVVGTGATSDTNIYIGTTIRNSECFVQSLLEAKVEDAMRTTAVTTSTKTDYTTLKVKYDDYRTSDTYTGSVQEISGYQVQVINGYKSITTAKTSNVYMTAANTTPKPTDSITVKLNNDKSITVSNPTYTQPASITDTTECIDRTITVSCTDKYNKTVSRDVTCHVVNKPTSATVKTQPAQKTVSTQTQFPASSVTGGQLTVTYANGQTATRNCTSYATTASTKLTGTTASGTFDITGYYRDSACGHNTVSATMSLKLVNTPKSASFAPGNITLSASGQQPKGTLTVTYDNGHQVPYTNQTSTTTIYSSGTTTNSGATQTYSGSVTVYASVSVAGETMTGSGTCSWTNPLTSLVQTGTAYRDCATSGNKITMSNSLVNGEAGTVTYASGATKAVTPTLAGNDVDNVTGTSYYHSRSTTGSFTENNVTVSCTITVSIRNPVYTVSVGDKKASFPGYTASNASTAKISSITATIYYRNGAKKSDTVTPSITVKSGSVGTNTAGDGWVQCVYTGTSEVYWDVTYTASYTENGRTATGDFKASYTNTFSVFIASDTNYTSAATYTAYKDQGTYPYRKFNSGNTTTVTSSGNWAVILKFQNGQSIKKGKTTSGSNIPTSYSSTSQFKNGDSFVATTDGSLQKWTFSYTIDGYTDDDWCYGLTYTGITYKYTTDEVKLRHSEVTSHHAQPSCWRIYNCVYAYYGNGKSTAKTAGYWEYLNNGGSYYWWFGTNSSWGNTSQNNRSSASSGTNGLSNLKGSYTGAVARTSLSGAGWYGNDGYIVVKIPASVSINNYLCSAPVDGIHRFSWASGLEFMGY